MEEEPSYNLKPPNQERITDSKSECASLSVFIQTRIDFFSIKFAMRSFSRTNGIPCLSHFSSRKVDPNIIYGAILCVRVRVILLHYGRDLLNI